MAKKTKIKFTLDLSLFSLFALISMLLVVLDAFILKGKIMPFIVSPTVKDFSFSNPLSYVKIVFHILGSQTTAPGIYLWLYGIVYLIFAGTEAEKTYGTVFLAIMVVLSSIFSGVLAACLLETPISAAFPVVFLLNFLTIFGNLKKNTITASSIIILAAICAFEVIITKSPVILAIDAAGGLCGSLISFLAVPNKKPKAQKKAPVKSQTRATYHDGDNNDDTTIIGTFEI